MNPNPNPNPETQKSEIFEDIQKKAETILRLLTENADIFENKLRSDFRLPKLPKSIDRGETTEDLQTKLSEVNGHLDRLNKYLKTKENACISSTIGILQKKIQNNSDLVAKPIDDDSVT